MLEQIYLGERSATDHILISLGGSSNWLNNFAVAMSTSDFIETSQFGAFIFFGAVTTVGVVWVYFFVSHAFACYHSQNH